MGLSLAERISYDESRNTLFANFEGLQVRTIEDVELIRREFERTCRAIGRKVHLIVNYDGFALDEAVSDAYFSTITYLQQQLLRDRLALHDQRLSAPEARVRPVRPQPRPARVRDQT